MQKSTVLAYGFTYYQEILDAINVQQELGGVSWLGRRMLESLHSGDGIYA